MKADRSKAVVPGHRHRSAQPHLQAGTSAAATAEEIHHNLVILRIEAKAVLSFEVE